ncbi:MAG: hypothetical protein MI861_04385 [Pirellulales bacterium]|nr:hypothetical protein [Pirellulales bacterium]
MVVATNTVKRVGELDPREAAEQLLQTDTVDAAWLDTFSEYLDRRRSGLSLAQTLALWDLSQSEAARLFGVSRQALSKWFRQGIPSERAQATAELAAASDLLVRYIKRERIPAVVRRPIPALDGVSLLDLLERGRTGELLKTCRDMFDFKRVQA